MPHEEADSYLVEEEKKVKGNRVSAGIHSCTTVARTSSLACSCKRV